MPSDNLIREEARVRAELVSNVSYEVFLDVTTAVAPAPQCQTFSSESTINFDYNIGHEFLNTVFVELKAQKVDRIVLNDQVLDNKLFSDHRIELPTSLLRQQNRLVIAATCEFMNTGEGLHRYFAEEEEQVYLYSQFEVPDAKRVYACFDQPDLKATFDFTVRAPKDWILTSTEPETNVVDNGDGSSTWHFGTTDCISTYLTSLVAGPFEVFETEHLNADGRTIPMRILARKSLQKYVDADVIFDITKKGFDFYAKLFGVPYPYTKYDQIFMPQFNAGAMENVANVVFREDYIFNVKVSDAMKERRTITILHELAHMWFGNLVTMKWWGDLWLNESFAEYVSIVATDEAIGCKNIWVQFNGHEKPWGMRQDEMPTTHPIVADIKDLNDVLVNFDGITYGKGAASLQALANYIGFSQFFQGVGNYLRKYSFSNAELADLLNELQAVTDKDVQAWSKQWLETASFNTLAPDWLIENGKFTQFNIVQTAAPEHPTLRSHAITIGCYNFLDQQSISTTTDVNVTATGALNLRGAKLQLVQEVQVDISSTAVTNVPEMIGVSKPDFILLNNRGTTFARILLDSPSQEVALHYVHKIADPLARTLTLEALWVAVRDSSLTTVKWIDALFKAIASETESIVLRENLLRLEQAVFTYTKRTERGQIIKNVGTNLWGLTREAAQGSDAQYQFLTAFTKYVSTGDHVSVVHALLKDELHLKGLELDNKLRWSLRVALARVGEIDRQKIVLERGHDKSEHGRLGVQEALGAINTTDAKWVAFEMAYDKFCELSNSELLALATGFADVLDNNLLSDFADVYFQRVTEIWQEKDFQIAETILREFYPVRLANLHLAQLGEQWLDSNSRADGALRRIITELNDATRRALRIQKAGDYSN